METHKNDITHNGGLLSEETRIEKVIEAHIKELLLKRREVLSKVQSELDDIDRALRHLGHEPSALSSSAGSTRQRKRAKISDSDIKALLHTFMSHGVYMSGAEILKRAGIKASRFANFKAANKGFLASKGAKRAMTYTLA